MSCRLHHPWPLATEAVAELAVALVHSRAEDRQLCRRLPPFRDLAPGTVAERETAMETAGSLLTSLAVETS